MGGCHFGDPLLVYIYTDGASRSNPGESASGYAIFDDKHKQLFSYSFHNGIKTNNCAEYIAMVAALIKTGDLYGYDNDIEAFSDSMLMVRQITGEYKTKNNDLRELNMKVRELCRRFRSFGIKNVPRENEYIAAVDADLNRLLDSLGKDKKL